MNKPVAEVTTAPKSFTCGKCNGRGRLNWAAHYANGVCFWCNGTGRIAAGRDLTDAKWYRIMLSNVERLAEAVMWGVDNGRDDYAEAYMKTLVADLQKLGTDGARGVLKHVRAGQYYESATDETHTITQAQATQIIERLIELGREAQQSQAAA